MRFQIQFLLGVLIFTSCTQTERSDIEKITIDTVFLRKIKAEYATLSVDTPKGYDFYRVEIYKVDSVKANLIFKDSLDNVLALRIKENGKDIFAQEFYANGQAKGKTDCLVLK